ncbi:MAG: acyl-CoA dehydrogenase [Proteobacteria bacterium]|nr:acyl-CoA dehydrogenase [Pseudomonadota bacterium]
MENLLVDKRDQSFVLQEMLRIKELLEHSLYNEYSYKMCDMALKEAHKLAKDKLMPTNKEADDKGCIYNTEDNSVKMPESYHALYKMLRQGNWIAMCESAEVGGEGFPLVIGTAISEVFYAGSVCLYGAAELTHGAAKLIEVFGDSHQKKQFLKKLYSGEWMGTMCLTESGAGSDVGAIETKAAENDDGTYSIYGTKIFISAGEHDLTENIVHMVLARVEGDPSGTKGLSLFIVPKYLVGEDGKLEDRNDVRCTGIEHKMGCHGLCTCTMVFGDKGGCVGYLLGEQRKGILEMFHMMNEQRLLVGIEGLALSSSAYLHAVDYTKSRIQGVSIHDNKTPVPIIQHPDIKRMLLTMKAYVEGCRALSYFTSLCIDYAKISEGDDKAEWEGLVNLLIPIVKAYITDRSWEITGLAIQCAGGYGYCSDYPFERFARDCKITSLFEGTNGIQAMDLLFRKLIRNKLVDFHQLMKRIDTAIEKADDIEEIKEYAKTVRKAKDGLIEIVDGVVEMAKEKDALHLYIKATPFLEAMGDVVLGWMHLWQLTISHKELTRYKSGENKEKKDNTLHINKEAAFYAGKISSAKFYIGTILKRTIGKFEELKSDASPVMEIIDKSFAG